MARKAESTAKKKTRKTTAPGKKLVIVESPSKAKTIEKMLGSTYKVIASVGHVRDLPKSKLGIDVENDFEPNYISIRGKGDIIKELRKEAKKASRIYLATDPDREGEAISWHLAYLLGMDETSECRVTFNEITKDTVKEAIKHPRRIDLNLVDAQQARRVLDRLVGYQISPLLWRKIKRGLSAGRVQSAALKIICDREREILAFNPEEYWTVWAEFEKKRKKFKASLLEYDGQKIVTGKDLSDKNGAGDQEKGAGRLRITSKKQADQILKDVDRENFKVVKVTEKEKKTRPSAPFTTSSMQQAASTRINFNPKKTMKVAQELYEGVNIKGRGTVGLITYMRTDSVRIADEARAYAQSLIKQEFGQEYVGTGIFSNKKKGSQDAHEAIRPTDPGLRPDDIRDSLTSDQYKLYKLIWTRFMASQMADAIYDGVSADIQSGKCLFRAAGSKVKFEGYLKVYNNTEEEKKSMIPALEAGENLKNTALEEEQHFTQPPSRFTEASLVKKLEDSQIGRPSTYAPIVGTLTERRYVKREKKTLFPTELGMTVDGMMEEYFKDIVDSKFTAEMENKLDSVEEGEIRWRKVVGDFYGPFNKELEFADKSIEKVEIEDVEIGRECPECGRPLVMKQGRFGEFIACKGYPECKHTETIMHTLGVQCPACGKDLVQRRSRKGKYFYGCSGYPECNMVFWNKPVNRKCPKCGSILLEKVSRNGKLYVCSSEECKYTEKAEDNRNE